MKKLSLFCLGFLLVNTACNIKVKSDKVADIGEKPVVCARTIVRDMPADADRPADTQGAVRTAACETLVVGQDKEGQTVMLKYGVDGKRDETFGDAGLSTPLAARYADFNVRIERMSIINEQFYAFGSYGTDNGTGDGTRALFAFRFLDSGFLDLDFGPLRDGVVKAAIDSRFNLTSIGAPTVENDRLRLRNRGEDAATGTVVDRDQVILLSGSEALPKDVTAVPATCALINHQAFVGQTQYQITQSSCGAVALRTSGPRGGDALTLPTSGVIGFSNVWGDLRWSYEGGRLVRLSRDGLGFVRKDFVEFEQGQTSICGTTVDARRRYLVFSAQPSDSQDWLTDCSFL